MKICTIDIGTNSVIYLLSQINKKGLLQTISFKVKTTRLGKSLKTNKYLSLEAQKRTVSIVKIFIKDAHKRDATHFILAGTSAIREAKNSIAFKNILYKNINKKLNTLSGKQEAYLVFIATKHYLNINNKNSLIIDIGGGSTELIFCNKTNFRKLISIPIGAIYLTEIFENNLDKLEEHIKTKMKNISSIEKDLTLIGVGGTITTLAAVSQNMKKYNPNKIHKHKITITQLNNILIKLSCLNLEKRKNLMLFDPKRADIIISGLVILKVIMEKFNKKILTVCNYGLAYGLTLDFIKKNFKR